MKIQQQPTCFLCNSPLIFVSEETIKPEGSRFSQTNTVYRCSNEDCQKLKDKEKEKRLLARQKKEDTDKERAAEQQRKKDSNAAKALINKEN